MSSKLHEQNLKPTRDQAEGRQPLIEEPRTYFTQAPLDEIAAWVNTASSEVLRHELARATRYINWATSIPPPAPADLERAEVIFSLAFTEMRHRAAAAEQIGQSRKAEADRRRDERKQALQKQQRAERDLKLREALIALCSTHMETPEDMYFAGHFDGEGSVSLEFDPTTGIPSIRCCVTNTDRKVLDLYVQRYGGNVYAHRKDSPGGIARQKKHNVKQLYQWCPSGQQNIYRFILHIEGYTVTKKQELLVAKEWLLYRFRYPFRKRLPDEAIAHARSVQTDLRRLKREETQYEGTYRQYTRPRRTDCD